MIIHNVQIENMETGQGEIIGISNANDPNHDPSAYGGKVQVGPVGSVFQVQVASTAGAYVGNVVSDAKLFVGKFSPGSGTVNITEPIINWALSRENNLEQVLLDNNYYFVSGGDSMAHVMKGIIGLFVSAGKDIKCFDMQIRNIKNASLPGADSTEKTASKAAIVPLKTEIDDLKLQLMNSEEREKRWQSQIAELETERTSLQTKLQTAQDNAVQAQTSIDQLSTANATIEQYKKDAENWRAVALEQVRVMAEVLGLF